MRKAVLAEIKAQEAQEPLNSTDEGLNLFTVSLAGLRKWGERE